MLFPDSRECRERKRKRRINGRLGNFEYDSLEDTGDQTTLALTCEGLAQRNAKLIHRSCRRPASDARYTGVKRDSAGSMPQNHKRGVIARGLDFEADGRQFLATADPRGWIERNVITLFDRYLVQVQKFGRDDGFRQRGATTNGRGRSPKFSNNQRSIGTGGNFHWRIFLNGL